MRTGEIAQRVEHLVAHVPARLWREPLPSHAGHTEHFERRPTLAFERACPAASWIERVHGLIAPGDLKTGLVHHPRRAHPEVRRREHEVAAVEHGAAAARHVAAEGLDVLVEVVCPVDARDERVVRFQLMIDLAEELAGADVVRHVARLDDEAGAPEDRGRCPEVLPEKRHVVRVVDRHEIVRADVEPLERREEERPVSLDGAAGCRAVLLLRVRRLLAIDRLAGWIEPLEVLPGVQRIIAEVKEEVAVERIRAAPGHDVHDAARGFAELGRKRAGQYLELPDRFLAERRTDGADNRVVVVEPVHGDVVRARALAGKREARGARRALLRRAIGRHPRRQQREADEIAAVDREPVDLILSDDARDRRSLRIDDGGFHCHVHRFLAARDVQRQAHVDQAPQREHDALEGSRQKPLQLGPNVVPAGRQRRNHEVAALVGHGASNVVRVDVLRRNRGAGQHRGRLIDDCPRQIRRRRAGLPGRGRSHGQTTRSQQ